MSFLIIDRDEKISLGNNKHNNEYFDYNKVKAFLSFYKTIDNKKIRELINYEVYKKYLYHNFLTLFFDISDAVYTDGKMPINEITDPVKCCIYKDYNSESEVEIKNKKYSVFVSTMMNKNDLEKFYGDHDSKYYETIDKITNKYILLRYILCFHYLKKHGNCLINLQQVISNDSVDALYLGLLLFKKMVIYHSPLVHSYIYFEKFDPIISIEKLSELYNGEKFVIDNKPSINTFADSILSRSKELTELYGLCKDGKYDDFTNAYNYSLIHLFSKIPNKENDKDKIKMLNKYLFSSFKKIYDGEIIVRVHSNVNIREGEFISSMIKKHKLRNCLEIGMAFGISATYILENENTKLISIDPFQTTQWKSYGLKLLKQNNMDNRHELIQEKSYVALPDLLKRNIEFDFIFIDGWHTFDYTLLDFFYADKMLKIGGLIIIDDALHKGVSKTLKYLNTNYKYYQKVDSPYTVGCYKKLKNDDRNWDFHVEF